MAVYKLRGSFYAYSAGVVAVILILLTLTSYNGAPKDLLKHATQPFRGDLLDDIQNSTLGFQKIYVINLPSRTDNRDAMALAASVTGLEFEFVDGVREVSPKALPPGGSDKSLSDGERGNWRAHMNVAQRMVENNIASALILEDDADWDLRIKQQMTDFAKASRLLVQPLPGAKDQYLDPTYPQPQPDDNPTNFYVDRDHTARPTTSPYGDLDKWDMFWIGHCGTYFPSAAKSPNRPIGRVVLQDDKTVPEKQHIGIMFGDQELRNEYPQHTRVVTRANRNICTYGYALSLQGARHLLYEFGIRRLDSPTDIALRSYCDGDERPVRTCLTVQPELIGQHRPVGDKSAFSNIAGYPGFNEQAFSRNIRWSTKLNLEKLMDGETDYIDLFQDGEEAKDWGWG